MWQACEVSQAFLKSNPIYLSQTWDSDSTTAICLNAEFLKGSYSGGEGPHGFPNLGALTVKVAIFALGAGHLPVFRSKKTLF